MSYYPTQIESVGNGTATDVQGKKLRFVGNLPCQAGDTVWTDGNVIFGNSTPKTAPLLDDMQAGIPVVADKIKDDSDKKSGYLLPNGKFRKRKLAAGEWIVNDDKNYEHGEDEDIIDAEIDDDGDLWTVTDGFYRFKSAPTFHNHLFTQGFIRPEDSDSAFSVFSSVTPYVGQLFDFDFVSFADIPTEDTDIVFYKNGAEQFKVNLKQFADIAEDFALEAKDKILEKSNKEDGAVNWTMQPAPPDDFIALSYAAVVSLHVDKKGDWDAIISAAAMGFCFPYLTFDGSIFDSAFPNNEDKTFSENLISCINSFEDVVFKQLSLPVHFDFEQYPEFEGDETDDNDNYTPAFQKYILDKVAYYIPLASFRYFYWFPVIFSACQVLRVHNGNVTDTIYKSKGGGNVVFAPEEWNEKGVTENFYDDFVFNFSESGNEIVFPLDEDFSYHCENFFVENISADNNNFSVPEDVYTSLADSIDCYYAYGEYQGFHYSNIDSEASLVAAQYNLSTDNLYGRQILTPALSYDFSISNNSGFNSNPRKINYPYMSGWFKKPDEDNDDVNISYSFANFRKNKFLLGVRGGDLYRVEGTGKDLLGTGLKNFRLRDLLNIYSAKK